MPGVALHLICAQRVLQRWRTERDSPPFCLDDPRLVEAFLQGAVAPDMGYFLAGTRRISDLAHQVRSADLARAILQHTRSDVQVAYAWGWATHLLADVAVHPLINRAAGELIHGHTGRIVTAGESPASHVRVELGLDAYFQRRSLELRGAAFEKVFAGGQLRFLAAAYRQTHGSHVGVSELWGAQVALLRLAPWLLRLNRLVGAVHAGLRGSGAPSQPALAQSQHQVGLPVAVGFMRPVVPRPWLVRAVGRVLRDFAERFLEQYRAGLQDLPNHDLDTGLVAAAPVRPPRYATVSPY